jgi:hypothetical protein
VLDVDVKSEPCLQLACDAVLFTLEVEVVFWLETWDAFSISTEICGLVLFVLVLFNEAVLVWDF